MYIKPLRVQWSFRATGFQTSSHHISVTWTMPQNSDGPKLRGCPENAFCAMYLWGSSNYGGSRLPSGLSFAETRNRGGGASGPVVVTTVSNERAFATLMNDGSIRTWGEYGENGCTGQNGEQGCTGPPSEVTSPSVPGFVPVSSIASVSSWSGRAWRMRWKVSWKGGTNFLTTIFTHNHYHRARMLLLH